MAKTTLISGNFRKQPTADEELATLRTLVATLKKDPKKLRKVAVKAGIVTNAGNLTKAYKNS